MDPTMAASTPPQVPVISGPAPGALAAKKEGPIPTTESNPMGTNGTAVTVSVGNAPGTATLPAPTSTGENQEHDLA